MEKLIFFLLFLLSFVIFPFGISPFETPKVYVAEFSMVVLVLWYGFSLSNKEIFQRRYLPLLVLGLVGVVHVISQPQATIFFGNVFRMQGVFLLWLLLLFALVVSRVKGVFASQKVILFLFALQLIATVFIEGKIDGRGIGTLGEPNALAAFVIFAWPWIFFTDKKDRKKWLMLGGISIAMLLILFSGSRSGFIAFGLQSLFLLLKYFNVSFSKSAAVCLALFIASLLLPFMQRQMVFENRADVWRVAFAAGAEKPIIGWGIGNTEKALHDTSVKINNVVRYQKVDSSHNVFLDWWVQGGIIGLGLFLYIVGSTMLQLIRQKETLHVVLLIGIVTVMSFNPVSIVTLIHFWWILGWGIGRG